MDDELVTKVALGLACRELAKHIPETPEQIRKDLIQRAERIKYIKTFPVNIEYDAFILASCKLAQIENDVPYKIRLRLKQQSQELLKGLIDAQ